MGRMNGFLLLILITVLALIPFALVVEGPEGGRTPFRTASFLFAQVLMLILLWRFIGRRTDVSRFQYSLRDLCLGVMAAAVVLYANLHPDAVVWASGWHKDFGWPFKCTRFYSSGSEKILKTFYAPAIVANALFCASLTALVMFRLRVLPGRDAGERSELPHGAQPPDE